MEKKSNEYCFCVVNNERIKHSIKVHSENYIETATGMMLIVLECYKHASMYIYELRGDGMYHFIHSMNKKQSTIMPDSFEKDATPFTLNHILNR